MICELPHQVYAAFAAGRLPDPARRVHLGPASDDTIGRSCGDTPRDRLRRRPRRTLVVPTPGGVGQSRPRGAAEDRQHREGRDVHSLRGIGLLDDGRSDLPRRPGLRTDRSQPARSDRDLRPGRRPRRLNQSNCTEETHRTTVPRMPPLVYHRTRPATSATVRAVRISMSVPARADDRLPGPVLLPPAHPGCAAALAVDRDRAGRPMRPPHARLDRDPPAGGGQRRRYGRAWPAFAAASSFRRSMVAGARGARVPAAVPIALRPLMIALRPLM